MWARLRPTQRPSSPTASAAAAGRALQASSSSGAATEPAPADTARPLPQPPREPGPEDCCQSGCEACVWDVYAAEMKRYKEAVAAATGGAPPPPPTSAAAASVDAFAALEAKLEAEAKARRAGG
jgi:hypothetical protein